MTDTGNEVCFSGPIHITESGDQNKLPDTGAVAGDSDAQEATEGVHNTKQEQSESLISRFPERLPSTSQRRRKRRATTLVPGSNTQQETMKTRRSRGPNWTSEETQKLRACKLLFCLPEGLQGWEIIAVLIGTRTAVQCRRRWCTLQNLANKALTTSTSSGPAANEPNGASTTTHPVGKTNLRSSACPNLEVSHCPVWMPAAFPVEPGPAAVAPAGWSPTAEVGAETTKKHPRCAEATLMQAAQRMLA